MKKITSVILAVLTIFLATACNTIGDSNTESTTPEEPDVPTPVTLSINGVDISNFKIVYSPRAWDREYQKFSELVKEDTEFDKQSAEHLAEEINKLFGVELQIVKDTEVEESDYEINIGSTNRDLKDENVLTALVSDKDYVIKETNNKLLIAGSTYGATWHAVDAFIEQATSNADIPKDYFYTGKANMISIGFIGDSITQGAVRQSDRTVLDSIAPFPSVLQAMEWKDLSVYNYGHNSRTMMEDAYVQRECVSYIESPKFNKCLKNAENLDVIVIMLGTNDTDDAAVAAAGQPISSEVFKNKFIESCQCLIETLTWKNPDLEIIIATSPVNLYDVKENTLENYIRKYQKEAADFLGLKVIDVGKATKENMTNANFSDTSHPNEEGYVILAKCINDLLKPILNETLIAYSKK